jgi:hypothetical protein
MRKNKILLVAALAVALLANLVLAQASPASAQDVQLVGLVVDYVPGQSITIVGQDGIQHQFELTSLVKILPPELTDTLKVGSYVTIIAPNKLPDGKNIAAGIVVHPKIPDGFPTKIAIVKDTMTAPTKVLEPTVENPTKVPVFTETATATPIATGTVVSETPIETATPVGTVTETTTTTTSVKSSTPKITTSFIEWFRILVRQLFANG